MSRAGRLLAIIPARGGSKGLPRKNLQRVGRLPLIAQAILVAKQCREIDRCLVSTDAPEIARVARRFGAEVPFLRPAKLAQDNSATDLAIRHAVRWLDEHERYRPEYILVLQPTSPFRTAGDLRAAIRLARARRAVSVVSVSPAREHPYWMKRVGRDGRLLTGVIEHPPERRQALPPFYRLNGAIYLIRRDALLAGRGWYTDNSYAYIMPPERSLDVDTPWELYLARLIRGDHAGARTVSRPGRTR